MENKTIDPQRIYSIKEVAELLGANQITIQTYCRKGFIVARKIRGYKILGQAVINFLNKGNSDGKNNE